MNQEQTPGYSSIASNYGSPNSNVALPSKPAIGTWKPLLLLLAVAALMGIAFSDPVKPMLSRNTNSLLVALFSILSMAGMIWWAKCDSIRFNYKLTKKKVWLIALLGPPGIIIYSFLTRNTWQLLLLIINMFLFTTLFALTFGATLIIFSKAV